ncbi:hypothetical protein VTL71DRAFT_7431, partial [Oculimacula yallundae]
MTTGVSSADRLEVIAETEPSLIPSSSATISSLAKDCLIRYDVLCEILRETSPDTAAANGFVREDVLIEIQDARPRYKAWATNIAALQESHLKSSLDFRLREALEVRSRVLKILESLRESLHEAELIATGVRGNKTWEAGAMSDSSFTSDGESEFSSDGSDSGSMNEKLETSELDELLSAIKTANSSLMDISIVIRNTPTRDDYVKAAARYSLDSHWDVSHVDAKFGASKRSSDWLIQRLGKSITRRRQYLTYRKEHHEKLSKDWEAPAKVVVVMEDDQEKEETRPSTLALTKATTYVEALPAAPKDGSEVGSFETETSYQQTVAGETQEHLLSVPPPPTEAFEGVPFEFGHPFQCPYCWTEQNVKGRNAWKKHVFRDLRPYVCTFKECNLRMFRSRNEWFAHELQAHRREWTCATCSKLFSSKSSFKTHVLSHDPTLAGSELDALILQSEEPMDRFPASACSFCNEWEEQIMDPKQNEKRAFLNEGKDVAPYGTKTQFRRHLGRHMEQLALFALPRDNLDDVDDDSDREIRGEVNDDDSDASTGTTLSEHIPQAARVVNVLRKEVLRIEKELPGVKLDIILREHGRAIDHMAALQCSLEGPWGNYYQIIPIKFILDFQEEDLNMATALIKFESESVDERLSTNAYPIVVREVPKIIKSFPSSRESCLTAVMRFLLGGTETITKMLGSEEEITAPNADQHFPPQDREAPRNRLQDEIEQAQKERPELIFDTIDMVTRHLVVTYKLPERYNDPNSSIRVEIIFPNDYPYSKAPDVLVTSLIWAPTFITEEKGTRLERELERDLDELMRPYAMMHMRCLRHVLLYVATGDYLKRYITLPSEATTMNDRALRKKSSVSFNEDDDTLRSVVSDDLGVARSRNRLEVLQEEVTRIRDKLPYVIMELAEDGSAISTSLTKIRDGYSVYILLKATFPTDYPDSRGPSLLFWYSWDPKQSSAIDEYTRKVHQIAERCSARKSGCLEAIFDYLNIILEYHTSPSAIAGQKRRAASPPAEDSQVPGITKFEPDLDMLREAVSRKTPSQIIDSNSDVNTGTEAAVGGPLAQIDIEDILIPGPRQESFDSSSGTAERKIYVKCCKCADVCFPPSCPDRACPSCTHEWCSTCTPVGQSAFNNAFASKLIEPGDGAETTPGAVTSERQSSIPYEDSVPDFDDKESLDTQRQTRRIIYKSHSGSDVLSLTEFDDYSGMCSNNVTQANTSIIFIGHYTISLSVSAIASLFTRFGLLAGMYVPAGRNFAYLKFVHRRDAQRAIEEMNGHLIDGCNLVVDFAAVLESPLSDTVPGAAGEDDLSPDSQAAVDQVLGSQDNSDKDQTELDRDPPKENSAGLQLPHEPSDVTGPDSGSFERLKVSLPATKLTRGDPTNDYVDCENCKVRDIKCDRVMPQCLTCLKNDRQCGGFPEVEQSLLADGTPKNNSLLPGPQDSPLTSRTVPSWANFLRERKEADQAALNKWVSVAGEVISENPESNLNIHPTADEKSVTSASKPSRKPYISVRNVSSTTTMSDLRQHFEPFGEIVYFGKLSISSRVVIEYALYAEARAALGGMNGKVVGGNVITVKLGISDMPETRFDDEDWNNVLEERGEHYAVPLGFASSRENSALPHSQISTQSDMEKDIPKDVIPVPAPESAKQFDNAPAGSESNYEESATPRTPNSRSGDDDKIVNSEISREALLAVAGIGRKGSVSNEAEDTLQEQSQEPRANRRAERKKEIKRRAMLLEPPIPAHVLSHMPAYQAAIVINSLLSDTDWEELKPKLISQRKRLKLDFDEDLDDREEGAEAMTSISGEKQIRSTTIDSVDAAAWKAELEQLRVKLNSRISVSQEESLAAMTKRFEHRKVEVDGTMRPAWDEKAAEFQKRVRDFYGALQIALKREGKVSSAEKSGWRLQVQVGVDQFQNELLNDLTAFRDEIEERFDAEQTSTAIAGLKDRATWMVELEDTRATLFDEFNQIIKEVVGTRPFAPMEKMPYLQTTDGQFELIGRPDWWEGTSKLIDSAKKTYNEVYKSALKDVITTDEDRKLWLLRLDKTGLQLKDSMRTGFIALVMKISEAITEEQAARNTRHVIEDQDEIEQLDVKQEPESHRTTTTTKGKEPAIVESFDPALASGTTSGIPEIYPPCNTLMVTNLPFEINESEVKELFTKQPGFRRMMLRHKETQPEPICFLQFDDIASATWALRGLYGLRSSSSRGDIRLAFAKNELGVRSFREEDVTEEPTSSDLPMVSSPDVPAVTTEALGPLSCTLNVMSTSVEVPGPLSFQALPASLTVKQLKRRIRDVLTSEPPDEDQRFVYYGRTLGESETMLEIFGQPALRTLEPQKIHLILRPNAPEPASLPSTSTSAPRQCIIEVTAGNLSERHFRIRPYYSIMKHCLKDMTAPVLERAITAAKSKAKAQSENDIFNSIYRAIDELYSTDPEHFTVNTVRTKVETDMGLEPMFLSNEEWRAKSKRVIADYTDEIIGAANAADLVAHDPIAASSQTATKSNFGRSEPAGALSDYRSSEDFLAMSELTEAADSSPAGIQQERFPEGRRKYQENVTKEDESDRDDNSEIFDVVEDEEELSPEIQATMKSDFARSEAGKALSDFTARDNFNTAISEGKGMFDGLPNSVTQQNQVHDRRFEEGVRRPHKCGWNGCDKAFESADILYAHRKEESHQSLEAILQALPEAIQESMAGLGIGARIGKDEMEILEREFQHSPKPTTESKRQIAEDMGVDLVRITNWFQNRRAKRKQEIKQEAIDQEESRKKDEVKAQRSEELPNSGLAYHRTIEIWKDGHETVLINRNLTLDTSIDHNWVSSSTIDGLGVWNDVKCLPKDQFHEYVHGEKWFANREIKLAFRIAGEEVRAAWFYLAPNGTTADVLVGRHEIHRLKIKVGDIPTAMLGPDSD